MLAKHVLVSGRVQGVWFRAWTQQEATRLGLSGWVRNRRDGRVEAVVAGEAAAVTEMLKRFRHGPPAAQVSGVESTAWSEPVPVGFRTLPTA